MWQQVKGRNRCTRCGSMIELAWCWFANLTTWTHCYCQSCVEELLEEGAE